MAPRFQTHGSPLVSPTRDVRTKARTMRRSFAVLAAILVGMVATPVLASSYSMDVGSPTVSRSQVAVTVPVEVTCPELDPSYTLVIQSITVGVRQAVHGKIAHGMAFANGSSSRELLVECNGTAETVNVTVLADPSGPPFKNGWMTITATGSFSAGVEFEPGCGCGSILVEESFSSGVVDRRAK
jgi:hypothetical protein